MQPSTALIVIVSLVIGGFAGWNFRTFRGVNADIKVYKARLPVFKQVRTRSALVGVSLVVLTLLALRDLVH